MNGMYGIERGRHFRGGFVSPLQGGMKLLVDLNLGLRAERFTPGFHRTGFQPSTLPGPKARHVILRRLPAR